MNGPLPIYRQWVKDGEIRFDRDQIRAIEALQALSQVFQSNKAESQRRFTSGLQALRRKRYAEPLVRGLYLYGPAGRGKSMLMDLFFNTVPVTPKRRVHFHAFMQEVHSGIAAARKQGTSDPVQPVADALAKGAVLLCIDEMQVADITDALLVGRLFERLLERGLVIVTTSNRQPDDLYKGGWNREMFLPFIALIKERLAEAIDVLILEDVPILSPKRDNEAKRFVTMIDALYEAKVRLIVSAAGEPDDLYSEGEGAFEFGRTASRLEEMRSAGWPGLCRA